MIVRIMYWIGWFFLVCAFIQRATMEGMGARLLERGVMPRNFFELSLLAFVISIASAHCCKTEGK
jgi:hypothetical protein